jgi:hypothetical protein
MTSMTRYQEILRIYLCIVVVSLHVCGVFTVATTFQPSRLYYILIHLLICRHSFFLLTQYTEVIDLDVGLLIMKIHEYRAYIIRLLETDLDSPAPVINREFVVF